ncbi:TPA: hypothetical protein ACH3X1_006916 [Trebouxia sp. C0004]
MECQWPQDSYSKRCCTGSSNHCRPEITKTSKTASILGTGQSTGCTSQAAGVQCKIGGWTGIIPKDMVYTTPEEDLVVFADNAFARMEKMARPNFDQTLMFC